jgi:hypothetical protein
MGDSSFFDPSGIFELLPIIFWAAVILLLITFLVAFRVAYSALRKRSRQSSSVDTLRALLIATALIMVFLVLVELII